MTVSSSPPRTLLFYAPALLDGGAERVWARLASAFAARGDSITFAVDFEATQSAPFLSRDVTLEVLPRGHFQSTRALARLIEARRPDATHHFSRSAISSAEKYSGKRRCCKSCRFKTIGRSRSSGLIVLPGK